MADRPSAEEKRQYWQFRIQEWKASQLSLAQWSKEQGLPYGQCIYWKDRIAGKESAACFVELPKTSSNEEIRVELHGVSIYLPLNLSEESLKRALQAIAAVTC